MKTNAEKINWTPDRVAEFDKLSELLRECRSLNTGNNIMKRIGRIEQIAEELCTHSWGDPVRRSFTSFLLDLMCRDNEQHQQ